MPITHTLRCGLVGLLALAGAMAADPVVIVDDTDASAVFRQGTWSASTSTPNFYGTGFLFVAGQADRDDRIVFRPTLPETARYEVAVWYKHGANRSSAVPITVTSALGAPATVTVDQRSGGGVWRVLGTWPFSAGHASTVTIATNRQPGLTIADAVRFRRVGAYDAPFAGSTVDIDDSDPRAQFSSGWTTASAIGGYTGNGYHTAAPSSPAGTAVVYRPHLPTAGVYDVAMWYPAASGNSPNTTVQVQHRDGTLTRTVDQRAGGSTWKPLGRLAFGAGAGGSATISRGGTVGNAIADGMRFRLHSAPFGGAPHDVGGIIQAEDYDRGKGIGYAAEATGTPTYAYRSDDIGIESVGDALCMRLNAEIDDSGTERFFPGVTWLNYAVEVDEGGLYDLKVRGSNLGTHMRVFIDGVAVTDLVRLPFTGYEPRDFTFFNFPGIPLTAGIHDVRFMADLTAAERANPLPTPWVMHFDYFYFSTQAVPHDIANIIQAEDYAGADPTANPPSFRHPATPYRIDDVGIIQDSEGSLGMLIRAKTYDQYGGDEANEGLSWLSYDVQIPYAGRFDLFLRAASVGTQVRLYVDGAAVSPILSLPFTDYELTTYAYSKFSRIFLTGGRHRIEIHAELGSGEPYPWPAVFDYMQIIPSTSALSAAN